jgi:hypothetical protein
LNTENLTRREQRWFVTPLPEEHVTVPEFAAECLDAPIGHAMTTHQDSAYHHLVPPNGLSCYNGYPDNESELPYALTASSDHPQGVNIALADGAVRFVSDAVDHHVWWAIGTRAGGEAAGLTGG